MELLLWRWSLAVQFASLAMITVFFAVLARSTRRVGLRSWVLAWSANLLALGWSLVYWYVQPKGAGFSLVAGSYMATKTAFLLLVIDGTQRFRRPDSRSLARGRGAAIVIAYSLTVLFIPSIDVLGVVQNVVTGGLFALGGYLALSPPRLVGTTWLGAALWIRSALSFLEAGVFAWNTVPNRPASTLLDLVLSFLAASFIDTGASGCSPSPAYCLVRRVQRAPCGTTRICSKPRKACAAWRSRPAHRTRQSRVRWPSSSPA